MKCKTPDCQTTMSEGAPDYCPKCQQPQPTPEGKAFGDRVRAAMAGKGEACDAGDGYAGCQWINGECAQCGRRDTTTTTDRCEACKGTGSIWHGDPPATFEAECHFCGGTGEKAETLVCWVCDQEMTRRQGKVICLSCDMEYRRVKSELVVSDDLQKEWCKASEKYEDERDRYREALESILEAGQNVRTNPLATGLLMRQLARDALVGRAAGAGGEGDTPTTAEKETNEKLSD